MRNRSLGSGVHAVVLRCLYLRWCDNIMICGAGEHGVAIGAYWHCSSAASYGDSGYLFCCPYSEVSFSRTSLFHENETRSLSGFLSIVKVVANTSGG